MHHTRRQLWLVAALGTAVLVLGAAQATKGTEPKKPETTNMPPPVTKAPSIQGTWKLVARDLPDGTKLKYPNIVGLMNFTEKHRNFNICFRDSSGKHFSLSMISEYRLTEKEYSEKNLYRFANDEIAGGGLQYDVSGKSDKSPIKWDGSRLEIRMPLFNEPSIIVEGNKLTAMRQGEFIDHWEKAN